MTKLENLIKEKIPDSQPLSFDSCTVNKKTRTAHFLFFSSSPAEPSLPDKIAALIKAEANARFSVSVEIQKPPKTAEGIRAALKEYIKSNFLPIFCTLGENDISVDRAEEGNITVCVTVKDSLKSYADSGGFSEKCSDFLRGRYLTPSNIILRIDRGDHAKEISDYFAAQNDYKKVKPQAVAAMNQQNIFEDDGVIPAYLLENNFVVFDFETTGFDGLIDKIIEIGAVKVSGGMITEAFSSLINPKMPIPKDSIKIHGITDAMVKDAPAIEEVLPDFLRFAEGCPLVGHNVVDFDSKFLRAAGLASGITLDFEYIDTLHLSRQYIRGLTNYKLGTVSNYLGAPVNPDHRALADARAAADVFVKIIKRRDAKQ